jgi:hypothetical protein
VFGLQRGTFWQTRDLSSARREKLSSSSLGALVKSSNQEEEKNREKIFPIAHITQRIRGQLNQFEYKFAISHTRERLDLLFSHSQKPEAEKYFDLASDKDSSKVQREQNEDCVML